LGGCGIRERLGPGRGRDGIEEGDLKLIDALRIAREPAPPGRPPLPVLLAVGFTPLHLATFLAAHLRSRLQDRAAAVQAGPYGDLVEALGSGAGGDALAVVVEWPDLDPRLDLRRPGPALEEADLLAGVAARARRLRASLEAAARSRSVAALLPTLPLAPRVSPLADRLTRVEAKLQEEVASLASSLLEAGVRVGRLASDETGWDVESHLAFDFPYTLAHASRVAEALAALLAPAARRKALVTDLDGTLWHGILGDDGVRGVSWDHEGKALRHALYQELLRDLSDRGVLLAALSKNDSALVAEALAARDDLILPAERLSPRVASWEPKSSGLARILEALHIGAGDVVVVDDSPMELAELQAAYPDLETIRFPPRDRDLLPFLRRLQDLLAKEAVTAEDGIRARSLASAPQDFSVEGFLEAAEARLAIDFSPEPDDPRALELVNKTNQFHLNGRRYTDAEWRASEPGRTLLVAGYEDKYGPLGRIGVARAELRGKALHVDVLVLSCRAFSRRVEHQMVAQLLLRTGAESLVFDYERTPRNGPVGLFLASLAGAPVEGPLEIAAAAFRKRCPPLYHRIGYGR
jgi:FkbH-like protein